MKYLDYRGMKEFYTIDEVCRLFRNQQAGAQTLRGQVQHSAAGGSVRQLGDSARFWCESCTILSTRSSIISLALRRSPIRGRTRGHEK